MVTYLLLEKLPDHPGVYGVPKSEKDIMAILPKIGDYAKTGLVRYPTYLDIAGLIIYFGFLAYKKWKKTDLLKWYDIVSSERRIGRPEEGVIDIDNTIRVYSETLDGNYRCYSHRVLGGTIFKRAKDLELILPRNSGSELIILRIKDAQKIFDESTNLMPGLYLASEDMRSLLPLADFAKRKWDTICTNIAETFSHLGAKNMTIKDVTSSNIDLKSELKRLGATVGAKYAYKHKFEYSDEFDDALYSPEMVKNKLSFLNDVPMIKSKAKQLIAKQRTGKMNFKESLQLTFNLDVDVVATFNGVCEGGFQRDLEVEIEFARCG